jgi:ribosomal protein L11 methyltransferase
MSEPDTLVKLELTVPAVATDAAVVALAEISPQGFEEHDEDGPPPRVRFVVYGESGSAAGLRAAMEALVGELKLEHGAGVRLDGSEIPQENWREAWKVHFTLQRVDPFVIRPSWIDYTPAAAEHLIHLDPGSAFGTGIHETTRLCLRALAALDAQGRSPQALLDFGCGTGILGIGACLLWSCDVVAVDDDPYAITACEENAERNGFTHRIHATDGLPAQGSFEVVLANVSCPVLVDFAGPLAARLAPDGRLVLSGLLVGDREAICAAYQEVGLEILAETQETDWLCLVLGRIA